LKNQNQNQNQNPDIEKEQVTQWPKEQVTQWPKEQVTQWPKEKVQTDKQRSTKHTHKAKDRLTRIKTGGELMCSGRVRSSYSTSGTRRVNLVTDSVISHE
jgi:sugar diacid utilization regulator